MSDTTVDGHAARVGRHPRLLRAMEASVAAPVVAWLVFHVALSPRDFAAPAVLLWILVVALVDVMPVPAWGGMQLSLSFPVLLAVALLYAPPVAALVAFLGSFDPREVKLALPFLKALFIRGQMALAIVAGSALYHSAASDGSSWYAVVAAVVGAAVMSYSINTLLVALYMAIDTGVPVTRVLVRMHGSKPHEFLVSYLGLGLFGALIARFYLHEGFWAVAAFFAPLVFARQMFFRSRALEETTEELRAREAELQALSDKLAAQNEKLGQQAAQLEEHLLREQESVRELRELNRMKTQFVTTASHELRTPLTSIIGYVKTLMQPDFENDARMRREFLEALQRQGDRLLRLVENLLVASSLESNRVTLSLDWVSFEELATDLVEGLGHRSSRIYPRIEPGIPSLLTDRHMLGRVISNLLDNALKYSPDGTPCELGARKDGEKLVVWVEDRGVGIPKEELERIFERFYQVDSSHTRTFPGIGLGLNLVVEMLEYLGGAISVTSEAGRGSRFTVMLPLRHPEGLEGRAPSIRAATADASSTG